MSESSNNLKFVENLMVDSGAFSVWKSGASVNLDEYISFCLRYKNDLQVIVALDVIPGCISDKDTPPKEVIQKACEEGWENYLKMLSAGLPKSKVIPVFHQLDGWEWLQRYLDFGSPYIGLSPRKNGIGARAYNRIWLDHCMKYVCDKDGNPKVKLHGFGITNMTFLYRYPWYSCDSIAWKIMGMFGKIMVPYIQADGTWNFLRRQRLFIFSTKKGAHSKVKGKHYDHLPLSVQKNLEDYIHSIGLEMGESRFREEPLHYKCNRTHENVFENHSDHLVIEEKIIKGVRNDTDERNKANLYFFERVQSQLPWPRKYQFFEHSIL